jgi:hypothetical protein
MRLMFRWRSRTRRCGRIAALLAAVIPGSPSWRRQVAAEFLKEGLHAVAEWWLENPGPSREEIIEVVTGLVWSGQLMKGHERN